MARTYSQEGRTLAVRVVKGIHVERKRPRGRPKKEVGDNK